MTTKAIQNEFSHDRDALDKVLHEKPVPGMSVVCMHRSMASLKLTFWPGAYKLESPPTVEWQGLPDWKTYKETLVKYLQLRPADNLHQPWAIFSPDGELLVKEDNPQVNMEGFAKMGMVLVFQGGQFIWPGVRIGFKRTIQLYSIMPAGSPPMDPSKNRTATLETLSLEPLVFSVEGFLEDHECDWIQQEATPTLQYSQVTLMDMDKGRPASDFRTSQSTFLTCNNHEVIKDIDYRTASLVRLPRFHQETVQVLRYQGGEKYDAHHDYFDPQLYQSDENTL
jgi:prolyl 4-hydroxylase